MNVKQSRIKELVTELNIASEVYYSGQRLIMSDHEWDEKFHELEVLEKETGIVLPDSPTVNVSHEKVLGAKEKHEFPALSLPKSKSVDDVLKWVSDKDVNVSWKLDGLTLVVTYDNGHLTKVVTRGDGEVGSNITHLADAIQNIPKAIKYDGHIVIRGEAVISYSDFESFNSRCDNVYENPRNLAAGSCNPLSQADAIKDRGLIWLPFAVVYADMYIDTWSDRMYWLRNQGFKTVDFETVHFSAALPSVIDEWSNRVSNNAYPVDGLVITYDDSNYASHGTLTGHHDTRGGFAFKWADEKADTVLKNIEWSVSINAINPVAIFEPVRLEGTTVKRASLCNLSECERLDIGGIGTRLSVIKANKIIPKVVSAEKVGEFLIPDHCPVCGGITRISISDLLTKVLVCTNKNCIAKNLCKMSRFVSKHGFDIYGLSEKKLMSLVNKNLISSSEDILDLTIRADDMKAALIDEDGWGEKSIGKLLRAIAAAKTINAEKFLYALCIPMCGVDTSKLLAKHYKIEDFLSPDIWSDPFLVELVGDVKSSELQKWFSNENNKIFVKKLLLACDIKYPSKAGSKLFNMTFVVTGKLNHFISR
ncbi:MAG: hypothetical protein J6B73_09770, partial [Methanobrevibacter sp.]|uniref:hypothetical protein n=1 Tax=Methanobrevibacter sp. TaxID=66852 RepID=UPI001B2B9529